MAFFLFTIISLMEKTHVKHFALSLVSIILIALTLVACGPAAPTPEAATDEPASPAPTQAVGGEEESIVESSDGTDGYPAPSAVQEQEGEEAYPAPSPTAPTAQGDEPYPPPTPVMPTPVTSYPDPEPTPEDGIPFAFERPVETGDTVIRGVGPAGLEVSIVNVTFMGEEIATTRVGDDGQFEVEVPALEAGVRIGLTADIAGTDLEEQIIPGEGARNVPQVGYFFDTIVTVES